MSRIEGGRDASASLSFGKTPGFIGSPRGKRVFFRGQTDLMGKIAVAGAEATAH